MSFQHETVLLTQTVDALEPKAGGQYIDATLGGGGHTRLLLERCRPDGHVIAFDQDDTAIQNARTTFASEAGRLTIVHSNFQNMAEHMTSLSISEVDGVLFDLGVSSPQFDVAVRGFSYRLEGPLDMRMDRRQALTAETLINEYSQDELARIFFRYGEEKFSRNIAKRIVETRTEERITDTVRLAEIVKLAIPAPARRTGPHPARRVFQAIRIAVNDELGVLEKGIEQAFSLLKPGGRLAIISFHSLEDRIVKQMFREFATGCICPPKMPICQCGRTPQGKLVARKPIAPSNEEQNDNSRARSAKLRIIEKVSLVGTHA